jgi:hypothetical protein
MTTSAQYSPEAKAPSPVVSAFAAKAPLQPGSPLAILYGLPLRFLRDPLVNDRDGNELRQIHWTVDRRWFLEPTVNVRVDHGCMASFQGKLKSDGGATTAGLVQA